MKKVTDVGYVGLASIRRKGRVAGWIRNRYHLTGKELTLVLWANKKIRDTPSAKTRNKQVDECYRHLLKWLDKNGFEVYSAGKTHLSQRRREIDIRKKTEKNKKS
jgi:hypothetical protein